MPTVNERKCKMKLELQLSEIEDFIKKSYKHSIKIRCVGYNEIRNCPF
jgi:hypothetical protein